MKQRIPGRRNSKTWTAFKQHETNKLKNNSKMSGNSIKARIIEWKQNENECK